MRKLLFPLLFFLAACGGKKGEKNENTDYLVTLEGIGEVKTSMTQEELEKLLQQKVPLTNPSDTVSGSWQDSVVIKYKDAELNLEFTRAYAYTKEDSFHMRITRMTTNSPMCKTASGVGIGSTKQQVVDAFDNYLLFMDRGYDNDTDTVRSKTLYTIKVRESREGPQIIFYLRSNKVYSIEVGSFYDDAE